MNELDYTVKEPDRWTELAGIGKKRASKLRQEIGEPSDLRRLSRQNGMKNVHPIVQMDMRLLLDVDGIGHDLANSMINQMVEKQ